MPTPPRIIEPGRVVYVTVQAVNRQYRFVPKEKVVKSIRFIFWHYVAVHGMQVHDTTWLSNHYHICMTDVRGVLPDFMRDMNMLVSKQLNAIRDNGGTNIEKGYSDISVADEESLVGLCAYTLANPCAADLVSKASAWRGLTTYELNYNEPFEVERPNCGLWWEPPEKPKKPKKPLQRRYEKRPKKKKRNKGKRAKTKIPRKRKPSKLPTVVTAVLTRPNIMPELSDARLREKIRLETHDLEEAAEKRRKKHGKSVLGWREVIKRNWNGYPLTPQAKFQRIPRVAARRHEVLWYELHRIAEFNQAYRAQLDIFVHGDFNDAEFPRHTWKLRRIYNASVSLE